MSLQSGTAPVEAAGREPPTLAAIPDFNPAVGDARLGALSNVMEDVMRVATILSLVCLAVPVTFAVAASGGPPAAFPTQLQGTWNPVPYDCGLFPEAENDMRFEVSGPLRQNFEDIETIVFMTRISESPHTWRVTSTSNVLGTDDGQTQIYVLGDRYLFVTDGDRMDQYVKCD
ncbi:hypothetical protein WCE41_06785 [Luteimonas sp. MJ246]|uniref:hypothetical protein n=1 Tax=Luteimonas sp. MJ174 TaxID=3129237 RepID=UPI0031BA4C87